MYLVRIGTLMALLPPPPARVLDLGCGTGWTSLFFARAGYEVVGADIAPDMIRLANELRDREGLANASFVVSDYEALTFHNEFDAVVFFHSLHHADDEGLALRKAFAALKPGGVLLADEPGVGHAASENSLEAVAKFGVTEKDLPPAHLVELGRAAGFEAFRVFPCAESLAKVVYTGRAEPLPDPFADTGPAAERLHRTGLRRTCDRVLSRLRPTPAWRLTNVDHLLLHIHADGLVLMRKGAHSARAAA
ncbi:MAG: methyltransferase domain-containing protein [Planctomycetes bacterium]|nr:methyltransferase domain-containing protein [Planctomycetota bacterium]